MLEGRGERDETVSEMENCGTGKAPSIAEGIEQLCLDEELTAVVASRLGRYSIESQSQSN